MGSLASMALRDQLPSERRRRQGIDDATRRALEGVVLPLWVTAGLADWWCHRHSDIEHTAGAGESAIHLAMMAEGGLPTLLGLFCEANAGVLAVSWATLGLHELTAIWDVAYADGRRRVTPTEQHVHGFLERVPLMATMMLTTLHWDQALSALGRGGKPEWQIRLKRRPLGARYRAAILGLVGAAGALPYMEEFIRCLRAGARTES